MFDTSLYQVIEFNYDPPTRLITLSVPKGKRPDRYGGSTIDSNSVLMVVHGIPEGINDAWFEFAVSVLNKNHSTFRPLGGLIKEPTDESRYYIVEQAVLEAAFRLRKLPLQLVLRTETAIINSRNQITLEINRSINALNTRRECYQDLMFKTDSMSWSKTRIYKYGSVVTYNNDIYISVADSNVGNVPSHKSLYWRTPGDDAKKFKPVSLRFECTEAGQETEWILNHGMNTLNFVYSIRRAGANDYINAYVQAMDNRDSVLVQFSQPMVGVYTLNMIPCKETVQYNQTIDTVDFVNKPFIRFEAGIRLPRYVQTYDTTLPEPSPTYMDGNEFIPLTIQNYDEGYSRTDVYFCGGYDYVGNDHILVNKTGRAILISPDDTKVFYFTNKGYTEPATILGMQGEYYLIQLYDIETEERIFGDVTQSDAGFKIELSSDRTFVAILIKPTEMYLNMGYDNTWYYSIGTPEGSKYDGPVAVQCFDDSGKLLNPAIYTDDDDIYAMFQEGTKGRMLICGRLK